MQGAIERRPITAPEVLVKLEESKKLAQNKQLRAIRCPCCGFYLLDVYGRDHYLIRVKCRKCKFDETIDTALFRTVNRKKRRRSTLRQLDPHQRSLSRIITRPIVPERREMTPYGKNIYLY